MTPDLSPWHVCEIAPSISDASAGFRTSVTHKQTQREEQKRRVSPPGSSWPPTTTANRLHPRKDDDELPVSRRVHIHYPRAAKDYRSHQRARVRARI